MPWRVALLLGVGVLALPCPALALDATLRYQDGNRWVAATDNAPLRTLMKAARNGASVFTFSLPAASDRTVDAERVEILRGLLQREAQKAKTYRGLVLEESTDHRPPANRIYVRRVN